MKLTRRISIHILLTALLILTLLFPGQAWAQMSALDEVRELLRTEYVDPVNEDVLNSPTIDAILTKLGDPYTTFLTAAEYREFTNSLEQSFSGIGIYLSIVEEGVKITGLVSGSSAVQASLRTGDIIIAIDGRSVKGLSSEEVIPLIRGPQGSRVQLTVLRAGTSFSVKLERRNITVPSVTGVINPLKTGYLRIDTFGSETSSLFTACLEDLRRQNPKSYIVDLRDNGGGYVQTALDIAGYFVGDKPALQIQSRYSAPYVEPAVDQNYTIDKPTIFLINQYSASASEILTGAVKDYGKAVVIGTKSCGKGCMQELIGLDSGDYLKMTIARFTSPLGNEINKKGITPDLLIEKSDPLMAAELLLSADDSQANKNGLVKLSLASHDFFIDTTQAREPEYWQAYGEILDRAGTAMMKGKASGWESITAIELADRRLLYYPDYQLGNQLPNVPVDKKFTIHFPKNVNWQTANQKNIELIANDGERIPLKFNPLSSTEIQASPEKNLLPGTCYWLVIHPDIQYEDTTSLGTGVVCTASVTK